MTSCPFAPLKPTLTMAPSFVHHVNVNPRSCMAFFGMSSSQQSQALHSTQGPPYYHNPETLAPPICLHLNVTWLGGYPIGQPIPRNFRWCPATTTTTNPIPNTSGIEPTIPWLTIAAMGHSDRCPQSQLVPLWPSNPNPVSSNSVEIHIGNMDPTQPTPSSGCRAS